MAAQNSERLPAAWSAHPGAAGGCLHTHTAPMVRGRQQTAAPDNQAACASRHQPQSGAAIDDAQATPQGWQELVTASQFAAPLRHPCESTAIGAWWPPIPPPSKSSAGPVGRKQPCPDEIGQIVEE